MDNLKYCVSVFNDGKRQQLACLDGTIPVMYKGKFLVKTISSNLCIIFM